LKKFARKPRGGGIVLTPSEQEACILVFRRIVAAIENGESNPEKFQILAMGEGHGSRSP
jgi:hypothetical protein